MRLGRVDLQVWQKDEASLWVWVFVDNVLALGFVRKDVVNPSRSSDLKALHEGTCSPLQSIRGQRSDVRRDDGVVGIRSLTNHFEDLF